MSPAKRRTLPARAARVGAVQNMIEAMEDEDATENTEDTQSTGDWKVIRSYACASTTYLFKTITGNTGGLHA